MRAALLDTSALIAVEAGRRVDTLPERASISVVTLGELTLGVLAATSSEQMARRLRTLSSVRASFVALPIDDRVAERWAEVIQRARSAGRRAPVNDCWIAATALAHDVPVATQDGDYEHLGVGVIRL